MKILFKVMMILYFFSMGFLTKNLQAETPIFPEPYSHYRISNETLFSWREEDYGFSFQLTPRGQKNFTILTSENLNKPIELYVGDVLVSTPIVREVISSGGIALSADKDMKTKLRAVLPQAKEERNED